MASATFRFRQCSRCSLLVESRTERKRVRDEFICIVNPFLVGQRAPTHRMYRYQMNVLPCPPPFKIPVQTAHTPTPPLSHTHTRLFSVWHSRVYYAATRTSFATIFDVSESPIHRLSYAIPFMSFIVAVAEKGENKVQGQPPISPI